MAGRTHKTNQNPGRGGKIVLSILVALFLTIASLLGISAINADIVRIRRAEVKIPDLPASFDGVTLLYASDIDLCGSNTPEKSGILFERLQSLKPDILLLGGDYTSPSLFEILNRSGDSSVDVSSFLKKRREFFHYIASFDVPLGKYAIAAPDDPDWDDLSGQLREADISPLVNDRISIKIGADTLHIAGICQESASLNSAGHSFNKEECVLVAAYGPAVLPILLTSEASNGGQWADLVLCGHTHAGQLRLFGRTALSLTDQERRYLSGWHNENGLPILITSGVGCEGANLRLGTEPEVWLITLKKA